MQPVTGVPSAIPGGVAGPPGPPSLASSLPGCLTGFGGPQGGKQLFEKFWKGTFKAVAKPRAESVIAASITARRRVTSVEPPIRPVAGGDEREAEPSDGRVVRVLDRQPSSLRKRRKHGSHRRTRRGSFDGDLSPLPASKGKKKRRRSERKMRRKRSPSYSLSPQRKKKKKKKSSKKSKRNRYSSRKTKHSSSSLKHKRKDDRKHKKSSRGHSHRRRRHRRSKSERSACRSSSTESRHRRCESARPSTPRRRTALGPEGVAMCLHWSGLEWGPAAKSVCKPAPNYPSILATDTIVPSSPGDDVLNVKGVQHHTIPNSRKGPQDYDSGNDTSSPPSTKTAGSRANGIGDKQALPGGLASPEKLRFAEGDNVSDSGNSVTSYVSLGKPLAANHGLATSVLSENIKSEQMSSRYGAEAARPPQTAATPWRPPASPRGRGRTHSSSSRSSSRSRSSGRSRLSGRYSRSPTPPSHRLYSRSPSSVGSLRRRESVSSTSFRGSYSRLSPDRVQVRRGSPRGQEVKSGQGYKGKRRGGRSYSPMTKRRRDSPSHLEARRITSARKRPVPYFRPSPSSSSRSSSVSSWSSLFTRSRSRSQSPARRLGRSRTRSRNYSSSSSSYRSYSPSSSWNSIFGGRSPSRRL